MKTVKCASCGAPFEEIPGDDALRCEFCGAINERTIIRAPVPPPPRPQPPPFPSADFQGVHVIVHPQVRRGAGVGRALAFVFLILILIFGASGFALWSGFRGAVPGRFSGLPPMPKLPFGGNRTLADLRNFHDRGRRGLDVAPPSGGYARFDAVAQLPWALKAAQAWQADARLDRVDVSRVTPEGVVDAAADPDAEVMYRFVSPSRIAQYWREADVNEKAESEYELWVIAKSGGAFVQLLKSKPSSRGTVAPAPQVLTLVRTFERARARLPARPFYRGYMIYADREGWVWYFSTLSGRDSVPRVRARDGKTWPW